jgi:hypothetical protein
MFNTKQKKGKMIIKFYFWNWDDDWYSGWIQIEIIFAFNFSQYEKEQKKLNSRNFSIAREYLRVIEWMIQENNNNDYSNYFWRVIECLLIPIIFLKVLICHFDMQKYVSMLYFCQQIIYITIFFLLPLLNFYIFSLYAQVKGFNLFIINIKIISGLRKNCDLL